jgi:hypothetical protein
MTTRTYFLPPDFLSYPAATDLNPGAIRLGQLISSIDDPGHTIGTLPPLDMACYDMPINFVDGIGMGHIDNASSSFYGNLFLKAVELVGAKLHVIVQRSNNLLSAMEEIQAQTIDPKDSYVAASMQQPEVQSWLKQNWGRRRIFMVCSILIARPAGNSKVNISTESSSEISGEAEGNMAVAQAPVRGGAGMGGTFAKEFGLAFVPKSPFIYGFKLRECYFRKGSGSSKAYYKGAKLHTDTESGESKSAEIETLVFEFTGVARKDLAFESLGDFEEGFEEISVADGDTNTTGSLVVLKV